MGGLSVLKHVLNSAAGRRASFPRLLGRLLVISLVSATALPATAAPAPSNEAGERYLIVLRDSIDSPRQVAEEHRQRHGAEITHVYQHALKGYAAELPSQAIQGIARDPRVAFVEPDQPVEIASQVIPSGIRRVFAPANSTLDIDAMDDVRVNVDVAIIDTGVDSQHPDLNVASLADCTVSSSLSLCANGAGLDDHGHGTHVGGITGALDNGFGVVGVAPGARLHGVKVMSAFGNGLMSWVVAGIDWVTANSDLIEVANMSLGCRCISVAFDKALANSVDRGVVYVVAAGNSDVDAKEFSPANHPDVITVSALADFDGSPGGTGEPSCRADRDDTLADFSNWGPHVEIAAPGVCVSSTWPAGAYRTLSGTSMAAPHAAGVAAVLTSGANDPQDRTDVAAVRDALTVWGNLDWVDDSGDGTQEPLVDVGNADVFSANSAVRTLGSSPPPPQGNEPPVASFDYTCSELSCTFDASASSDADGTVAGYEWDLGDGTSAAGPTVEKNYASADTYTVRLTVVDDNDATSTTLKEVSVSNGSTEAGSENPISLTASGVRLQGTTTADLQWRGTDRMGMVVVYRNGDPVATSADDGAYSEIIERSSGSLTYKICEEGTTRCSNEVKLW